MLTILSIIFQDKKYPKIQKIDFLKERDLKGENKASRRIILDLRAVADDGTLINIEVQLNGHKAFTKRILYYGSDEIRNSIKSGNDFEDLPNLVLINILDFNLDSTDNFHNTVYLDYEKTHKHFTDLLRIHTLELPKFKNNTIINLDNPLHRLMLFFDENTSSKTIDLITEKDEVLKMMNTRLIQHLKDTEHLHREFVEKLEELQYNTDINEATRKGEEKGIEKGIEIGEEKGIEKGIEIGKEKAKEEKFKIALKLMDIALPLENISEITGLSIEELQNLKSANYP